jgi:hypothetical protein
MRGKEDVHCHRSTTRKNNRQRRRHRRPRVEDAVGETDEGEGAEVLELPRLLLPLCVLVQLRLGDEDGPIGALRGGVALV